MTSLAMAEGTLPHCTALDLVLLLAEKTCLQSIEVQVSNYKYVASETGL